MEAVNEIDWNVPFSRTVPFESFSPKESTVLFAAPVMVLPDTAKPSSLPLTRVMLVPDGNCSVEPSDPKSRTGSVVAAPRFSV